MGEIVEIRPGGGGGGPQDPGADRVARLEFDVLEMKATLRDHSRDLIDIKVGIARIEGQLKSALTTIQLLTVVLTTWAAGAAIVATLLRAFK